MQTLISQLAHGFVDDALVLATGFGRMTIGLVTGVRAAMRNAVMAPLDRIARACDVAGTLASQDRASKRPASRAANLNVAAAPRRRQGSDAIPMIATFRTLRDLS